MLCFALTTFFFPWQLPQRLNECDDEGNIPLNLALLNRHEGIANTLVSHGCDLDIQDPEGNSLLHLAILRGDSFSASFLIKNGANTILARKDTQETPLHLVAAYDPSQVGVVGCGYVGVFTLRWVWLGVCLHMGNDIRVSIGTWIVM